jgi:competence ComEA-like helix-hairpin-helix protein
VESPGSPGSSGGRNRGYLLLSLILLVWNTGAIARLAFEGVSPSGTHLAASHPSPGIPVDNALARPGPVSARGGPLSLRQKYLLGKRVDINLATEEEISELPGISDPVAAAVVAERARRGGFRSHRDLLSVPGIKGRRLEKILPFLAEMENN